MSYRHLQPMLGGTRESYIPVFIFFFAVVFGRKVSARRNYQRMQNTDPEDSKTGNTTRFPSVRAHFPAPISVRESSL